MNNNEISLRKIPIGIYDFKTLIEDNYLYIDKTLLIKDVIDDWRKPWLFPRPRRFGKTLNLSMLYYYFSNEFDSHELFKGLKIMEQGEKYLDEMNKYPTIFFSLRGLKEETYDDFIQEYKKRIWKLYEQYTYILDSDKLSIQNKELFQEYYYKKTNNLTSAIADLMSMLRSYYNEQVILLLDEYDASVLYAYERGYYDEIIIFMKKLFEMTFKDNADLKKGIITGILRLAIEDLGSGANNFKVYNITDSDYSNYFGFTESEVENVLKEYNLIDNFKDVKKWYDGYLFGDTTIYNPVSILNYLDSKYHDLISYWVNTGGVSVLKNLIFDIRNNSMILDEFHKLLETGEVKGVELDLHMNLKSLTASRDTIWTLFMLSGYLTPKEYAGDLKNVTLKVPNLEVKSGLKKIVNEWFKETILDKYNFIDYLMKRQLNKFKDSFENYILETFSYYDVPDNDDGERFYHAYTLGMLTSGMSYYEITSNRESGYGRYDILLKPKVKDIPGYVIEIKLVEDKSNFKKTIEKCFKQIKEMKYKVSLKNSEVIEIAIAFKGKKVQIETRN